MAARRQPITSRACMTTYFFTARNKSSGEKHFKKKQLRSLPTIRLISGSEGNYSIAFLISRRKQKRINKCPSVSDARTKKDIQYPNKRLPPGKTLNNKVDNSRPTALNDESKQISSHSEALYSQSKATPRNTLVTGTHFKKIRNA